MYAGNYNTSSPDMIVVSTPYVPGYKITNVLGFTWGLILRSRGLGGNVVASLRTIAGGEIKEYTQMLDQSRYEALERLKQHAKTLGANAVIEVRFDSSEIGQVMSEILAYGTAVIVEKEASPSQPVSLR
jgi:uncharacterized protein YbjQ (UPF0145 family)